VQGQGENIIAVTYYYSTLPYFGVKQTGTRRKILRRVKTAKSKNDVAIIDDNRFKNPKECYSALFLMEPALGSSTA